MGDSESPFEFFRAETSNDDAVVRTEAMSQAAVICAVMGPEKARESLLPYLLTKKGELDQVLLAMAQALEHFLPLIGGADHAEALIPLFELLCGAEETVVRSAAAKSCCAVLGLLVEHAKSKDYLSMFRKLCGEDGGEASDEFYAKVAVAAVAPALASALRGSEEDSTVLHESYSKLLGDEMSIVRRAAAAVFVEMFSIASPAVQMEKFVPLLQEMSADENPGAKVITVESYLGLAKILKAAEQHEALVSQMTPLIKAAANDPSWRVRHAIAKSMGEITACIPAETCKTELFPCAINLLMDNETDIRVVMCSNIQTFFSLVGNQAFLAEVLPIVQQLANDAVMNVRKASAELVVSLATKCGGAETGVNELVMKIIEDEEPLVRLRLFRSIPGIANEQPSLCTQLTSTLKEHFTDKNWRVRRELVRAMPAILRHMGEEYFNENCMAEYLLTLSDRVDEVRTASAEVLPNLAEASTPLWIQEKIFPAIKALSTDRSFIHRISFLNSLRGLMDIELPETFQTEVVTLMITSTNDPVPNVRLRAAQVLGFAATKIGAEGTRMQVRPVLNELAQDKDSDVKYFAQESLKIC